MTLDADYLVDLTNGGIILGDLYKLGWVVVRGTGVSSIEVNSLHRISSQRLFFSNRHNVHIRIGPNGQHALDEA